MKCKCGGELKTDPTRSDKFVADRMNQHRPWSKNRRIRKKQTKRHLKSGGVVAMRMVMPLMNTTPPFKCEACGQSESYYSAVGRNAFTVEPL